MPRSVRSFAWVVLVAAFVVAGCSSSAQVAQAPAATQETDATDFEKAVKASTRSDGLFTVYRDTTDGSLQLAIAEEQLDKEYIYFSFTKEGVLPAGHFRGQYRDNAVFAIKKYHNKIAFVEQNTGFYFNPESNLSRASSANISPSVLAVEKIVARDTTNGVYLIKADDLFLSEALHQVSPPRRPGASPFQFRLGRLSKEKSRVTSIDNYPENTDVSVTYVFENPSPINGGGKAVTDARNVSVTMQHTLLAMPANEYEPRRADPRVGYFTEAVDNLTSTSATPYRDLIHRWHLVKKNPDAALSEPVEPIVWWIENTTPERIRPIIKDAVMAWNQAFEQAGFKNAIQVKVQPDTATWEAGDIRYNVLRWTSSPNPPFGGYGPSFVNPRTGQILGADVMLEYVFLTNRLQYSRLFETAALPLHMQPERALPNTLHCSLGHRLHLNNLFGRQALRATGADLEAVNELTEQSIYYLLLHEVGHTLGLNHNMKASQMLSLAEVQQRDVAQQRGLTGSVMDYPAINIAAPEQTQGMYYTTQPGPYDVWAIQYGYMPASEDELNALLQRSTEPALAFGNDADDMRSPGKAIDPRVMIGDMSGDAVAYADQQMDLIETTMNDLLETYDTPGQSYEALRDGYLVLTGQMASAMSVVSRYIGGVYVDRAFIGQPGATQPYRPVPAETQQQAMDVLRAELFAPEAFQAPEAVYQHLQEQRRGFEFFGNSEDPKIHARALAIQQAVLAHLLHPNVLERITDTQQYGNAYPLSTYMADLTDAVFAADLQGQVNTFRQNLQLAYVNGLAFVLSEKGAEAYDYVAQSAALHTLREVEAMLQNKQVDDVSTQAHTEHVLQVIAAATATE